MANYQSFYLPEGVNMFRYNALFRRRLRALWYRKPFVPKISIAGGAYIKNTPRNIFKNSKNYFGEGKFKQ